MNKFVVIIACCSVVLWLLGLATIHSTTPSLFSYQLTYGLVGLLVAVAIATLNPRLYTSTPWLWYTLTVLLLLATDLLGVASRGSTRWLSIAGFQFQTSEFAKLGLILFVAQYVATNPLQTLKDLLRLCGLLAVPTILIFLQPDLGTALMVGSITLVIIIASGVPGKQLASLFLISLILFPIGLMFLQPYQRERLTTFFNPNHDPLGKGYNVQQATIAVGSGMFVGRGLGKGTQSHLKFLPERHTDFIYASFVEEFGLVGGLLVIGLYAGIAASGLTVAKRTKNTTSSYITIMIVMLLLTQATINIGMNIGIMPVTGITLPLVSYGGSSLISVWMLIGVLMGASRTTTKRYFELRLQ